MTAWKAFCETVHLAALGTWFGVTASAAAFAAGTFPIMRELDPALPAYRAYAGEHWLIAGGRVAQRVFLITDIVQFACALLSVTTLACLVAFLGLARRRPATLVRALSLGLALAALTGSLIIVAPQLNAALSLHWAAAAAGDAGSAAFHKSAVDQLHPIASKLMGATMLCVFIAFIAGLWSVTRPWAATGHETAPSRFEEPALLRRGRA